MRTTLTLDPDVMQLVVREAREKRWTLEHVVNEAVRSALGPTGYTAPVHHAVPAPGLDPAGFNRLADDLATLELVRRS